MLLTLEQAKTIAKTYILDNKIAQDYVATHDTVTGLLAKIGKMFTIQNPMKDELPELDGENLPLGVIIEEYFQDLVKPVDYDSTGANALDPHDPSFRPTVYSYDLGRKTLTTTIRNGKYDPYCLTQADLINITNDILDKLYSSRIVYRNALKMELVSQAVLKVDSTLGEAKNITTDFGDMSAGDTLGVGDIWYEPTSKIYYLAQSTTTAMVAGDVASAVAFLAYIKAQVTAGTMIEYHLFTMTARPVDATSTSAFLLALDKVMEKTKRASEGYSLHGNALGIQNPSELKLYIADGILPEINRYKSTLLDNSLLDFQTQVKALGDYVDFDVDNIAGGGTVYAVLVDTKGLKLHNTYMNIRNQNNAKGDFDNYVMHDRETAHISPNTFIHVFLEAKS